MTKDDSRDWLAPLRQVEKSLADFVERGDRTPAADRELDVLLHQCMQALDSEPVVATEWRARWSRFVISMAEQDPQTIPHAERLHDNHPRDTGERKPFPPTDPIEAAEATWASVVTVLLLAQNPRLQCAYETGLRNLDARHEQIEQWRRKGAFPKWVQTRLAKAATRGQVRVQRVAGQRALLYSVTDVVKKWGEHAREVETSKRQSGTKRDT